MAKTDLIKRAITWIRKSLEITEKTTQPGSIGGEIRPTVDIFGWDSYKAVQSESVTGAGGVENADFTAVPADVLRLLIFASLHTTSQTLARTLWFEMVLESGVVVGLTLPQLTLPRAAAGQEIRVGLERQLILRPGDFLRARAVDTLGGGETIISTYVFVDLPIGEYALQP